MPWIAVLDPDVTSTAQRGLYVVYLYAVDTQNVFLSMNQGATAHREHYVKNRPAAMGIDAAAIAEIRAEAAAIRRRLHAGLLTNTAPDIELGSSLFLPRGYEAGNIAATAYDFSALPSEQQLRADLQQFLVFYNESVAARQAAIAANPGEFNVPAEATPHDAGTSDSLFQPKDSDDYFAWIAAHTQRKTRKHEELINNFAEHAKASDWARWRAGVKKHSW